MHRWLGAALLVAALPAIASGDSPPRVVLATPGSSATNGGAIDRFTLRFSETMVPVGDPRAKAPGAVACPVAASGRWVDAQTYVFDFATALPGGLTCKVDLDEKLASIRGAGITGTRSFPIDTGGPSARAVFTGASEYADSDSDSAIEENQIFLVATNSRATPQSVAAGAYCAVDGIGERIAVDVVGNGAVEKIVGGLGPDDYDLNAFLDEAGLPQHLANAGERARALSTVIAVRCRRPLPPGRDTALVWGSGIVDASGHTSGREQRFDFKVRDAFAARFECSRVNAKAGCSPVEDAFVRFTSPIPAAQARTIRLTFADGTTVSPDFKTDRGQSTPTMLTEVKFKAPLLPATTGQISLPADLRDESGRPLENAARFPLTVRVDAAPPLVKFAAPFGILEAKEGGILPLTIRSVEPALAGNTAFVGGQRLRVDASDGEIARWLRRLDEHETSKVEDERAPGAKEEKLVNRTGDAPLLSAGEGTGMRVDLPGKGREFEVVGIPLAKPGFYVVEVASPTLGRALLGRDAPRYVAAGALVTNMAVHFKWGRAASLAWVTALDTGRPVAGAAVRVTNSCTGATLATGTSDAQGRLTVAGGLLEPQNYSSCDGASPTPALMVSARAGDDFSFTLTDWGKGIQPYDFSLNYGYSDPDDILHTVFDRALIKAGETVSMKHLLRHPTAAGFAFAKGFTGTLRLSQRESETSFDLPVTISADGVGESRWTAPPSAPMGDYYLSFVVGDKTISTEQSIRVDEFRLPTMRASVDGPKQPLVRPRSVPINLFASYLSGGGAGGLATTVRTGFAVDTSTPKGWDAWTFNGTVPVEGTTPLAGDGEAPERPLPQSQTLPVTLDTHGAASTRIDVPATLDTTTDLTVEMDYPDANGEVLTATRHLLLHPSAVRVGIASDGWLMRDSDMRLKLVALDLDDRIRAGQRIHVDLYTREVLSARRRLIGGFYAFDNQAKVTKLGDSCDETTDAQGLAECALDPGVSGEVVAVATTTDAAGNVSRAVKTVWLAGEDEWWFGGDNGDRMDLVPEQKSYRAGDTAKLQVRMPFRTATALVTVEREGVLSSFVTELSGKDPVIAVPLQGGYAPNVYVSVTAVRGRIGGWSLWFADLARRWHLPFFSRDGASPTAIVDLAKPSFRVGAVELKVGWDAHKLDVDVRADKTKYGVGETANVTVAVRRPDGKPAAGAEIAFTAVDEALLQVKSNPSLQLLDAMMVDRPLDVLNSSGQTQVVGKRHYGRKAVEIGGGGGADLSAVARRDFRPLLAWHGRVRLDQQGRARIAVPLSDSLSAFRFAAVATDGAQLFGTGQTTVRTTQDLQILAGLPPLVRTGDWYAAIFTLRNASDRPMTVTARVALNPGIATGRPLTVRIPAGGAMPVRWNVTAPAGFERLGWTVEAREVDGRASDRVAIAQEIAPAVPSEVWAASLTQVGDQPMMVGLPAGALPGGFVDVTLSNSLAPPLDGVKRYMLAYPYNCFEQQLSGAVALGDAGRWTTLAAALPTYLDRDGLVRYFPDERMEGSEALTAYVLSITAEAGLAVPDAAKARMVEALKAVVEGRLHREGVGPTDARYLRVAALGALARNGMATPDLVRRVDIAPADMPTALLADWMAATGGAQRAQAEGVLRQRLVFSGTRLDLTDRDRTPWWMMTSGDESAIKALVAVIGRPEWATDAPRMMAGVALRQRRGAWDTTPANAWGAVASRRFARSYGGGAITGVTRVALGPVSKTQGWPLATLASMLRLPLAGGPTPLVMTQEGSGRPWATVQVRAALPLRAPLFAGYRIARSVAFVTQRQAGRLSRGDVLRVTLAVTAGADRNWVVVSDPVPPGATIVGDLGGQSTLLAGGATGSGTPSYVERGRDAWRGYWAWLPAGTSTVSYTVRLNGIGRFTLPPTRVEAMYSPDLRAALPGSTIAVAP